MATKMSNGDDVVSFLKQQHQQIQGLFEKVRSSVGEERERQFYSLRRLLAVHETAEEEVVHPAARRALPNGEALVSERLKEENHAKQVLSKLESLDCNSAEFDTMFSQLESSVLAHAQAEEREEFGKLAAALDQERLQRMRRMAEFAEKVAPTRPHAGVESAAANLMAGPFVAMIDRARDALSGKSSSKSPQ